MEEKLFGILQPFRKLVVLINYYLVGLTTMWSFKFATDALVASEAHFLHISAIILTILGPITYLTKSMSDSYWRGRINA